MDNTTINWDSLPNYISKEQMRVIGHMSKSTALFLLRSGKVPCVCTGKKTRCYKIRKEDLKLFLEEREQYPEHFKADEGWYSAKHLPRKSHSQFYYPKDDLHDYYIDLLSGCQDILSIKEISQLIGYSEATILRWCKKGYISYFVINKRYLIPKSVLIDFFCSIPFRTIIRKSKWHIRILSDYANWKLNITHNRT